MSSDQQPVDPTKPDLEESTNVGKAHEEVLRNAAAASREQHLRENGLEPVSIWIMIAGFLVAIVGGSVLLSSDELFSYDSFVKEGYVRAEYEGGVKTIPTALASDAYLKKGKGLYANNCNSCHGSNGAGVSGPPLAGSEWVTGSGVVPALVMLHGVQGPITVKGKDYDLNMPAIANGWSDYDVAALTYYVQNKFGNTVGNIYSLEQIKEIREISKAYGAKQYESATLANYLEHNFKAENLTPETVINTKTGEVMEVAQ